MNKLDIFCFTSVARTKNFSLTARELMISQQAVSKHIKTLEEELGYQLLFRDSSTVLLTSAGHYIYDYLTTQKELTEEIQQLFSETGSNTVLRIAWSQWLGMQPWMESLFRQFQESHPILQLQLLDLDAQELLSAMENNEVDVLFTTRYAARYLPVVWQQKSICEVPLYLIRSAASPYVHSQMDLYPFFTAFSGEEEEAFLRMQVQKTCSKLGFSPQNITVCHDMGTVVLNTLLNNGMFLGAFLPDNLDGVSFHFEATHLRADVMFCTPYITTNHAVTAFQKELINFCEEGGVK